MNYCMSTTERTETSEAKARKGARRKAKAILRTRFLDGKGKRGWALDRQPFALLCHLIVQEIISNW